MKVIITHQGRDWLNSKELQVAKRIIRNMREVDEDSEETYAATMAKIASGSCGLQIINFSAEITKNQRIWNAYSNDSGFIDIWVKVYAYNYYKGFYEIGANLTDILAATGKNDDELKQRFYIHHCKPCND